MRKAALYGLIFISLTFVTACEEVLLFKGGAALVSATANDVFKRPEVNLRAKNYAAADYLAQQMKSNVNRNAIIVARKLEEADNPGISSPLGRNIPREVGLRLMELGYNVFLSEVEEYSQNKMYPAPPSGQKPDYILDGTYLRKQGHVDVKLRLIDTHSSRLVALFDYSMLMSREVRDTVKTPTQIFRVKE